jgi:hypothetical protein
MKSKARVPGNVQPTMIVELRPKPHVREPWLALRESLKRAGRSYGLRARAFIRPQDLAAAVASGELVEVAPGPEDIDQERA